MTTLPFPPRHAGNLLAAALDAAERAGAEEAQHRQAGIFAPWGGRASDTGGAELRIRQAAMDAASPLLRGLTADPAMVEILAAGMAEEVMIRLRKRGGGMSARPDHAGELRGKLVKVLARLGSEHDGERAAAGLLASRMLAAAGMTWDELLAGSRSSSAGLFAWGCYRGGYALIP